MCDSPNEVGVRGRDAIIVIVIVIDSVILLGRITVRLGPWLVLELELQIRWLEVRARVTDTVRAGGRDRGRIMLGLLIVVLITYMLRLLILIH